MDLPIMASLWIGGSLSYIEQVCLKSFVDHGHRMILYTYGEVQHVPPGVEVMDANLIFPNDNYIVHAKSGSPAVHADAFRYRMIELQNVVWVDADMLCVRPWDFKDQWIFGWEKPERLVCNAVMGLPRFSKTLAKLNALCKTEYPIPPWASDEVKADLEKRHADGNPMHVSEMEWGVWGPAALTHFLFETGEMQYVQPQMAFFPISFKDRRALISPGTGIEDQLTDGCYGVHLWNRRLRRRLVTNEKGFAPEDSFLGRALVKHEIDPRDAPIPDQPPASILEEIRQKAGGAEIKVHPFAYLEGKPTIEVVGEAPKPQAAPVEAEDEDEDERGDASTNPNVTAIRPKAMDALPVMKSVQSAEYQTIIDGLEGRTSNITGYLKDPAQEIDNSKILVVTSMKNEAPFILEWVAYHKAIGVDHFLVYTNDCTDNTNDMLDRLAELGHVTRVDNPWDKASGKKPQHVALKDALKQPAYHDANWILTIDCDEFVNIHVGDGTFDDLFRAANYPNVVSFTWKFFGNKDIHAYEDRPITEQFTNCAPEFIPKPRLGWGFKSMFHKTSPYTRIGVHRPLGIDEGEEDEVRWVNGSGRAMPDMLLTNNGWRSTKRSVGYRLATLNHYILRSAESFLVKRDRGRINHTEHDQGIDYWMRRNYASETDDRIHARLPLMQNVLDTFQADPQLSAMHDAAVDWHRGKIKSLLEKPDYKQLFDDLTTVKRPDALE
ncbi:MAG: glycosyltransferase family 2 protein, partial [Pseudomonadota bacterium]